MKIAFIVGKFPTLSETFILNQITGLIDLGHDVEIFAYEGSFQEKMHSAVVDYKLQDKTHFFNIPPSKTTRILSSIGLITKNLRREPLNILASINLFKYGKQALSLNLLYVLTIFLEKNFDIIYCHFGLIGNLGASLKELGIRGKLVTAFHGADMRIKIDVGKKIYCSLFKKGDKFLISSNYGYKKLLRFGADPKKIMIQPIGIDANKFRKQLQNSKKGSKFRIVTVARLVEEKGIQYGIKAVKEIVRKNERISLEYRIVGEGPMETELKKMVLKLKLSSIVKFLGPMTQEEIVREIKLGNIFLLPSVSESFGVVLLEAQATGLPIVATKVGGIPYAIVNGKSGFLVPAKNFKAMALKIEYLIRNKRLGLKMGEYGKQYVNKNYNISTLNHRLNGVFNELIKEG